MKNNIFLKAIKFLGIKSKNLSLFLWDWIYANYLLIIILTTLSIISFCIYKIIKKEIINWNLIKDWQSFVILFFTPILYFIVFSFFVLSQNIKWIKWKMKTKKEIKILKEKNQYESDDENIFAYKNHIDNVIEKIKTLFDLQDKINYTTNVLLIEGGYGSGKTFLVSNVLQKLKNSNNKEYNIYYIDLSKIEMQSENNFAKNLLSEIVKCISYKEYLKKLFNLKLFKLFTKNLPFDLINDNLKLKNRNKIVIVIDELDRCDTENIISAFSVLKTYFLNTHNKVSFTFLLLFSEEIIKPIVKDNLKITDINDDKNYDLFMKKIFNNKYGILNEPENSNEITVNYEIYFSKHS